MTRHQRRDQLLDVACVVFGERGFEAAAVEDVAQRAGVSKPVVYEHFGSKDGLYGAVVERETRRLLDAVVDALNARTPRAMLGQAADALLAYVEADPDGFRILVRDFTLSGTSGLSRVMGDVAGRVDAIVAGELCKRDLDPAPAPVISRALIGMVAFVGQWWLDAQQPTREEVTAHLVNLAWNGLRQMDTPRRQKRGSA